MSWWREAESKWGSETKAVWSTHCVYSAPEIALLSPSLHVTTLMLTRQGSHVFQFAEWALFSKSPRGRRRYPRTVARSFINALNKPTQILLLQIEQPTRTQKPPKSQIVDWMNPIISLNHPIKTQVSTVNECLIFRNLLAHSIHSCRARRITPHQSQLTTSLPKAPVPKVTQVCHLKHSTIPRHNFLDHLNYQTFQLLRKLQALVWVNRRSQLTTQLFRSWYHQRSRIRHHYLFAERCHKD